MKLLIFIDLIFFFDSLSYLENKKFYHRHIDLPYRHKLHFIRVHFTQYLYTPANTTGLS